MPELLGFFSLIITILIWFIIAGVIMSWLIAFGVINAYNPAVRSIWQGLNAILEPLQRPIRNALPSFGSLDISPLILLVILIGIRDFLFPFLLRTTG